jgi:1-acyl-sn-glycerol-3-phosphate acyltransferase
MIDTQELIQMPGAAAVQPEVCGGKTVLNSADIWRHPLPGMKGKLVARFFTRLILAFARNKITRITGAENVQTSRGPFILAANHTTKLEALALPALLAFLRGGRMVHFFADWNYQLMPVVGSIIRAGEPVVVTRKPARPAFLNLLRPLFAQKGNAMERGRQWLDLREPVGIFPEGTATFDPRHLLRGDRGAAWLSLSSGCQVVPAGIRFPGQEEAPRVREYSLMEIEFGPPLIPPAGLCGRQDDLSSLKEWHGRIMLEISRLSRKTWNPQIKKRKHENH